jgi:hypothetical protein
MPQHESEQSVFNMAMAYLQRLDRLLYKCQEMALSQNIDGWRLHLRGVYRELSVKLNAEEDKDIQGDTAKKIIFKDLLDNYIKQDEANFRNIDAICSVPQFRFRYKTTILYLLDALEVKMRRKLQEKGMLLPSRADPRFAILGG